MTYVSLSAIPPRPQMPATGISWNGAARFVNWLNTSQGIQAPYKFGTDPGDVGYDVNGDNLILWEPGERGYDAENPYRNSLSKYVLPSVDEWSKAAYFDPSRNDYWDYPTGSDTAPTPVSSGTTPGTVVAIQATGGSTVEPADITLAGGLSAYGVMALGGNVWEYEETAFDLVNDGGAEDRGLRGGGWTTDNALLVSSSSRFLRVVSTDGNANVGFRVVKIPEPGSGWLMLGTSLCFLWLTSGDMTRKSRTG